MKKVWIPVWILVTMTAAANGARKTEPDIVVYLHTGNEKLEIVGPAENLATRILKDAGVTVEFHMGGAAFKGKSEVIDAVMTAPGANYKPGALASAMPGVNSGTRIEIFSNRILNPRNEAATVNVLAYALVHEITHIIEGVSRHSETGIMKATWDSYDHQLIRNNSLHFAEEDLEMIQAWAEERHNQNVMAGLR